MALGLVDRRDIDFLLRDVLKVEEKLFTLDKYKDHDWAIVEQILDAGIKMAEDVLAPTNVDGDRTGYVFENGEVKSPESFKKAYKAFCEGGWVAMTEPENVGGFNLPRTISIMPGAAQIGANTSFFLLPGLAQGSAEMIGHAGTKAQIKTYVPRLNSGEWGGTMCLTEAGAGTDVGALRTTATQQPDGTWHIKGTKIFITWGDHDLTDNILYPVLARIEGDPAGTKGISIFLVSKYHFDKKGKLGERNGVTCSGVEHKMGIHASPTCTIEFGDDTPAVGELLGERCKGMRIMFSMMNAARIAVGLQGLGTAEAAYRYAHQYAIERFQGSALKDMKNADAPRVSIIKHPDVRRMLLDMRGIVEGARALLGFTALHHDIAHAGESKGAKTSDMISSLLTPLCKGYLSEVCSQAVDQSILVLGGHGYLADHPLEQYARDMVIARLYEGTTGVQAMDLVGRKLGMKGGLALMTLLGMIDSTVKKAKAFEDLAPLGKKVSDMRNTMGMTAMGLGGAFAKGNFNGPLLSATHMLFLTGDTVLAWLHLKMAVVAKGVEKQTTYHTNKVITARHFIHTAAGRVAGLALTIKAGDLAPMDMAFEGEEDLAN